MGLVHGSLSGQLGARFLYAPWESFLMIGFGSTWNARTAPAPARPSTA
jgi:hypothetical protein